MPPSFQCSFVYQRFALLHGFGLRDKVDKTKTALMVADDEGKTIESYPPQQFGLVSFPSRIERTTIKLESCLATFPSMRLRAATFL